MKSRRSEAAGDDVARMKARVELRSLVRTVNSSAVRSQPSSLFLSTLAFATNIVYSFTVSGCVTANAKRACRTLYWNNRPCLPTYPTLHGGSARMVDPFIQISTIYSSIMYYVLSLSHVCSPQRLGAHDHLGDSRLSVEDKFCPALQRTATCSAGTLELASGLLSPLQYALNI